MVTRGALLAAIMLATAGCSAATDAPRDDPAPAQPPPAAARPDALVPLAGVEGSWGLVAIDGAAVSPIDGQPAGGITIGRLSAGGSGGCNGGGGPALLIGDRLMMPGVVATEMACTPVLMAREAAVFETLSAMPRLTPGNDGQSLTVTGPRHQLRLVRRDAAPPDDEGPVRELAGRTVTVMRVDDARASSWDSGILLRFAADKVTLTAPGCAPASGAWEADGDRLRFAIKKASPCPGDLGVRALMSGTPAWRWLIDANGEVILATVDHMIAGQAMPRP